MVWVIVVFFKINDTVIKLRALKPCIYIAASVVDLAVDVLCLILHPVVSIVSLAEGVIENTLGVVND